MKNGDGCFAMSLDWDYSNRTQYQNQCLGNLQKNQQRFNVTLKKPTYSPGGYGSKAQQMASVDDSPALPPA